MKKVSISERLKEYMFIYDLRQIDVLNKCKAYSEKLGINLGKSSLSCYLSGKRTPDATRMMLLSKALNVSVGWLNGYDVPMDIVEEDEFQSDDAVMLAEIVFDDKLLRCIKQIRKLSTPSQMKAFSYVDGLYDAENTE